MEQKKTPGADLQNKRGLFLQIGLVIALLIVIYAFGTGQREKPKPVFELPPLPDYTETVISTRDEQKPARVIPIIVPSDVMTIVDNNRRIETEGIFTPEDFDGTTVFTPLPRKEKIAVGDDPVLIAEVMPSFQGGDLNAFRAWVMQRLTYPQTAAEIGIFGKVTLTFVIEKDGTLTGIEVLQSPDRSLSEEAARVLGQSPKWKPGQQGHRTVRVKYTLPVDFVLQH